jgi:hypothetical protein
VIVDLVDAVFRQSQATGRARLVLLALAHSASHENWTKYRQADAWTSQPRLAEMCGITGKDATREVRRHLEALAELGEIRWTGEVKGRGSKVWELLIDPDNPDVCVRGSDPEPRTYMSRWTGGASAGTPDKSASTPDKSTPNPDARVRSPRTHVSEEQGVKGKLEPGEEEQAPASTARGAGDGEAEEVEQGDRHTLDGMRLLLHSRNTGPKLRNELEAEIAELEAEAVR